MLPWLAALRANVFSLLSADTHSSSMLGIDVRPYGIAVVELERTASGYRILNMGYDAEDDLDIRQDPERLLACMKTLLQRMPIQSTRVAIGLHSNQAMVKEVVLPAMMEMKFEKAFVEQVKKEIPYGVDERYLDFQIKGPNADDPSKMDVMFVAGNGEVIDGYKELCRALNLDLCCVDYAGFCLMNAVEYSLPKHIPATQQHCTVLVFGRKDSKVLVYNNHTLWMQRPMFAGFDDLLNQVQAYHGINRTVASRLLQAHPERVPDMIWNEFFDAIANDLRKIWYDLGMQDVDIHASILCIAGMGLLIPGLQNALTARLQMEAVPLNLMAGMESNVDVSDEDMALMPVAVGLAMHGVEK